MVWLLLSLERKTTRAGEQLGIHSSSISWPRAHVGLAEMMAASRRKLAHRGVGSMAPVAGRGARGSIEKRDRRAHRSRPARNNVSWWRGGVNRPSRRVMRRPI